MKGPEESLQISKR